MIPTSDPKEALEFCRELARLVAQRSIRVDRLARAGEMDEDSTPPTLSVIIPVYDEEENLPLLYSRLTQVLDNKEPDYEIVFVDDGSRDKSLDLMKGMVLQNPRVAVVELARNFGHQVAISAGMDIARGRAVIIMDADLQDPPEVIPAFIDKWKEGHDVVYAIREKRKENWVKRMFYGGFYRLLQRIANINIPIDAGDFCIMDRKVVDIVIQMPERNRFLRGIRSWVGLNQVGLPYERQARYAGKPKFTFVRLVYLALDGLVSFSFMPLRVISVLGMFISFVSLVFAVFYAVKKIIAGLNPPGFATLVVSIFFFAGIQLITTGVIGEYIGRIFEEVKKRPLYITRQVYRRTA